MTSAFGGFATGLMQGIEARDQHDFKQQYSERMRQMNATGALDMAGQRAEARGAWGEAGLPIDEFDAQYKPYAKPKDPAGLRMFRWLGSKFGIGGGNVPDIDEERGAVRGIESYADGGEVKDHWSDYFTHDIPNRIKELPGAAFPNVARVGKEHMGMEAVRRRDVAEAPDDFQRGAAIRDYLGEGLVGTGRLVQAAADDVLGPIDEWVGSGIKGVAGAMGFGLPDDRPAATTPTAPPATTEPAVTAPPTDAGVPDDRKAAAAAGAPEETPSEVIASRATAEAEEDMLRNLDYTNLAAQGVRPSDLPSMNTRDWSEFRREQFMGMLQQGMSPREAYNEMDMQVIETQMRGFKHEATKAFQYLQTGQSNAAQLALTMAYQYFPNGANVEFATMDDPKTGRPVLVARGLNEETGEPLGAPQVITPDRINQMIAQIGNPDSWRVWTKDNRDLQMEIAQLESLDEYRKGSLEVAKAGAITDRMEARNRGAAATSAGGLKPSDIDRRSGDYREAVEKGELFQDYEYDEARGLADVMDRITMARPDIPPNTVIRLVEEAYNENGEQGLIELLDTVSTR